MPNLFKNAYNKIEGIKGKKLVYTLIVIFLVFTLVGFLVGYLISPKLIEDEDLGTNLYGESLQNPKESKIEIEGKVTYVNPEMYPMEDIYYSLSDRDGKEIYLLRSRGEELKLQMVEGLNVTIIGKLEKLKDGKTDVLEVEEVVIKSAAD